MVKHRSWGAARGLATVLSIFGFAFLALAASAQAAPSNDEFANAQTLSGSLPVFEYTSNVLASKQAGEPNHAGNAGGHSVWFSWTPSSSGPVAISTCAYSEIDTLLAVYTGSAVNSLTPVASSDDSSQAGCGSTSSAVTFTAAAGTTYKIAVDGKDGDEGSFELKLKGPPANDDFATPQTLGPALPAYAYESNVLASKQAGEPNHAGNAGGHSLWYSWTPTSSGPVAVSTCNYNGLDTLLAVYTGSAVNSLTPVASNDDSSECSGGSGSEVVFTATAGTTYKIAVDGKNGATGSIQLSLTGPPSNDAFAGAETVSSSLPANLSGTTKLATKQAGEPNHAGNAGGHSVWYSWTPSSSGQVEISTCSYSSSVDTLLAVYTGSAVNSLTPVASNDDAGGCKSSDSAVEFAATANTTYRIAVDGKDSSEGGFNLQLQGAPSNDDFANAQTLGPTLPVSASSTNKVASKQAGEPNHAGNAGGHSVWFSWTAPSSGPVGISTCSFSSLDSLLAVYTGSAVSSLTPVASNDDNASFPCGGSEVEFSAVAGTTYKIAVDGKNGTRGTFELRLSGQPSNDDFSDAELLELGLPQYTGGSNKFASKQAGEPEHAGDPGGHSVWYSWTPDESGPVSISTCEGTYGDLDTLLAVYTGSAVNNLTPVASNDDGPSTTCANSDSEVRFGAVAETTYWIAVDGAGESSGSFGLSLAGRPANDDLAGAEDLGSSFSISESGNNTFASKQAGEPNHAGNAGGHSVWFSWTPASSGQVEISTCSYNASLDTLLAVYTGSAVNSLTPIASNDDITSAGVGSECSENGASGLTFTAVSGTTYRIAVDGKGGAEGTFNLKLEGKAANDDFAQAKSLGTGASVFAYGNNKFASKQAGEPNHAGNAGGHSVWFSWTPSSSGPVDISTCTGFESTFDTLLAVYTGSAVNSLTPVASSDDGPSGCGTHNGDVQFNAVAGTNYLIAVDGKGGTEGSFELNLRGPPTNDDFSKAQIVTGTFASGTNKLATKQAGEPNHAGNAGGHSVWFSWTAPSSGTTEIRSCSGLDTLLAVYTGSAVNSLTPVASNDDSGLEECGSGGSKVSFTAIAGTTYKIAVDGKNSAQGYVELGFSGRPSNDDFESAQSLGSGSPIYAYPSLKLATKQAGEPNHAGNAGGHSVWYSWTPSSSGPVDISTCTYGELDTLLAVYTGSTVNSLTPVASNDDTPNENCESTTGSEVQFSATAGTTYRIAVDGKNGSVGSTELKLLVRPQNDDLSHAQSLGGRLPAGGFASNKLASKQAGEPNHAGNAGGHSIWFKWTAPSSGQVLADTCDSGFDTLLAVYTGSAVNGLTPIASNDDGGGSCGTRSKATFTAVANTTYKIAVDGKDGAQGSVELDIEGAAANDDFANAHTVASSLPRFVYGSTKLATKQAGEPNHAGDAGGHSVWYSWTPASSGEVTLDTCYAPFDTLLAVYTGATVNNLTPVASNDDGPLGSEECGENGGSEVSFNAIAGTTYRIAVDGKNGDEGRFELDLRADGTPRHMLTVAKSGDGGGTVTSSPAGIDCGSTCEHEFDQGTTVTLTAAADSNVTFTGWSGGGCSGNGSCEVELDANRSVTANFVKNAPNQRTLTVSKSGTGTGVVSSTPAGIDCGLTCSAPFVEGTVVTLTASPASDSLFAGWAGACSGTSSCQVTMSEARSVTATFNTKPTEGGGGGGGENGGGTGGGGAPSGGSSTPAPTPTPPAAPTAPKPKPKPLKCKAGFKKTRVHGKLKCVKAKKGKHRK